MSIEQNIHILIFSVNVSTSNNRVEQAVGIVKTAVSCATRENKNVLK